ncbi:MAG: hypothetical protein ABI333_17705 [bacterium]
MRISAAVLALLLCAACNGGSDKRGTTPRAISDDALSAIEVSWPKALQAEWKRRLSTVDWMRRYLLAAVLASRAAAAHGLPNSESLSVLERVTDLHWRAHFGSLSAEGQTFQASLQVEVTHQKTKVQTLAQPRSLPGALTAQARAILTAKTHLEHRSGGWAGRLQRTRKVWFNHFARVRPDQKVDVWVVAFPTRKHQVVLGGDYRFLISADGSRVLHARSLHSGLTVADMTAQSERQPALMNHIHRAREGELPTATDLLKLQSSPSLRGLVVIGPRYTLYLERHPQRELWSTRLLDSARYRSLLRGR